ncbi:hypothetical protein [Sporomusa sp. KB1]|jgi:hypothetical protein|nr:hypothetical protein [Sporomusa sp. KB1]TWH46446.1 hypothetical protein Salpa_2436 [Sporomusa sp. KB1]
MSNEENKQTEIQTDEQEENSELTDQDLKNVAGGTATRRPFDINSIS